MTDGAHRARSRRILGFAARQSRERRVRRYRRIVDPIDGFLLRVLPPLQRLAQMVVVRFGRAA